MPVLTGITLKCDFCGRSHGPEANPHPAGWWRMTPGGQETERVLCVDCLRIAANAAEIIRRKEREREEEAKKFGYPGHR